jgi:hypothetical protein
VLLVAAQPVRGQYEYTQPPINYLNAATATVTTVEVDLRFRIDIGVM